MINSEKVNSIIIYDLESKPEGILIIKNSLLSEENIRRIILFIETNRMNYYWNEKYNKDKQDDFRNLIKDALSILPIPETNVEWSFISIDEISCAFVK